jgi:hypothetical protein
VLLRRKYLVSAPLPQGANKELPGSAEGEPVRLVPIIPWSLLSRAGAAVLVVFGRIHGRVDALIRLATSPFDTVCAAFYKLTVHLPTLAGYGMYAP